MSPLGLECKATWDALSEDKREKLRELLEKAVGETLMKSYTIELRCDDDTAEKDEIILQAAKVAAKHLFTMACLIAGKRRPQIALKTSDMFLAESEISLAEDIPQEEENSMPEPRCPTCFAPLPCPEHGMPHTPEVTTE